MPPSAAATNLLPSAAEATETQLVMGALVCAQVCAKAGLTTMNMPLTAATTSDKHFILLSRLAKSRCPRPACLRFNGDVHRFNRGVAGLLERARHGLSVAFLVNRPAAQRVFARRKAGQQRGPMNFRQPHRPRARLAGRVVNSQGVRGDLSIRQGAPMFRWRQNFGVLPRSGRKVRIANLSLDGVGLNPYLDLR